MYIGHLTDPLRGAGYGLLVVFNDQRSDNRVPHQFPKMKSLLAFSSLAILFIKPAFAQVAVYGQCGVCIALNCNQYNHMITDSHYPQH